MLGSGGVGLGFRPELAADLLRSPEVVDFVEVVAESCFVQPAARREAQALAQIWPVVPHGVKLSLGSAEGIDLERARALGALARTLRAPVISEHVAFVRSGDREIGHLTAVPCTRAALDVVVRNVAQARRSLPDVPLLLENVAWSFAWPDSEMHEGEFYSEVARRTGCPLLLDVSNAYANAVNSGQEPWEALQRFPLDRVGMIHLAGGVWEHGFYFDDHAHAVPEPVFAALDQVLAVTGHIPILIERDASFPAFAELAREVARCREAQRWLKSTHREPRAPAPVDPPDEAQRAALEQAEAAVARYLTDIDEPPPEAVARFGAEALARSRAILKRKRVDEALPLLGSLSRRKPELEPLAHAVVACTPRVPRLCAISDAWHIAERALSLPSLADDARRDCLIFRSRFTRDPSTLQLQPRRAPFVGRETLEDGSRVWAMKGPGSRSRVRTLERNRARP
jgi:uncharacterized protein (UPF0276 family)